MLRHTWHVGSGVTRIGPWDERRGEITQTMTAISHFPMLASNSSPQMHCSATLIQ